MLSPTMLASAYEIREFWVNVPSRRQVGALAAALSLLGACLGVAQAQAIDEFSMGITLGARDLPA